MVLPLLPPVLQTQEGQRRPEGVFTAAGQRERAGEQLFKTIFFSSSLPHIFLKGDEENWAAEKTVEREIGENGTQVPSCQDIRHVVLVQDNEHFNAVDLGEIF